MHKYILATLGLVSGHDQKYEPPLWTLRICEKNHFAHNSLNF